MESYSGKNIMLSLLAAVSACLLVILGGIFTLHYIPWHVLRFGFLVCTGIALEMARFYPRLFRVALIGAWAVFAAGLIVLAVSEYVFAHSAVYSEVDNGKAALYADRRVMVVVPHQDDEMNLAGGVIEEYIRYGSEVYVVYATNGDYSVPAKQRLNEAINALAVLGVDEEHIIFLGYGDACKDENGIPLYNTDKQVTSNAGHSYTYTYAGHPPFREGRAYTRQNVLEDIRDVILEYRPDVIYGVDCDKHRDHQLTALMFDRAIGEILHDTDYKPLVFKGFAYSTAYNALFDFYQINISATVDPQSGLRIFASGIYDWNARVRMPVSAGSLSRAMLSSRLFTAALEHRSQDEAVKVNGIINGDKVFWRRETGSLCYGAQVTASSGDAAVLTDFMLGDTSNVLDAENNVTGIWRCSAKDADKTVTITFDAPQSIRRIKLYDDPSSERNILNAVISFDNGETVNTGALAPLGSETVIETQADNVRAFTLRITEYEGDTPGLTELEAYSGEFDAGESFIKLMNGDGDFAYDYYIEPSGTERFSLYAYGASSALGGYEISCVGDDGCRAYAEGDDVVVECPVGKRCTVTVSDGVNADTVLFRNSGSDEMPYGMRLDEFLFNMRVNFINSKIIVISVLEDPMHYITIFCNIKQYSFEEKLSFLNWGIHRAIEIVFGT